MPKVPLGLGLIDLGLCQVAQLGLSLGLGMVVVRYPSNLPWFGPQLFFALVRC